MRKAPHFDSSSRRIVARGQFEEDKVALECYAEDMVPRDHTVISKSLQRVRKYVATKGDDEERVSL